MSARLFRRITSTLSRLNKTFFFPVAAGLLVFAFAASHVSADQKTTLDEQYKSYLHLFDGSSISYSGLQKSTTDGFVKGIVFNINLNVIPSDGSSIENSWDRVSTGDDSVFVVKMCQANDPSACWLNVVPFINGKAQEGRNILARQTARGGYAGAQSVNISAFSLDASQTVEGCAQCATGDITGAQTEDVSYGGKLYRYNASANTVTPILEVAAKKGSSFVASLWYCSEGQGEGAAETYKTYGLSSPNITTFGTLCGGNSYFQVGANTIPFTIPLDDAAVQQQIAAGQNATASKAIATSAEDSALPACGIWSGADIYGCVSRIAYGAFWVASSIAGILGNLFDFFIGYSLDDASYRYEFAVKGWRIVRDISNIFFIIIMVYTGFAAVFDFGGGAGKSMKNVVSNLIINAILINFSLFFTRIVIDVSNVTARMFYSQMVVCEQVNINPETKECDPAHAKRGAGGYWPLSEKIVSAFNPQTLFQNATLDSSNAIPASKDTESSSPDSFRPSASGDSRTMTKIDSINYFIVVCLVAAIIMSFIGVMFYKVAFLFIGRVIGLYICMIFAPFAFLSRDIPMFKSIKTLRWSDWTSELTNYAILAPFFVFFLYVIYTFLSSNFIQQIGFKDSGGFIATALSVIIPMFIVYELIKAAQSTAEKYAGEVGKNVAGMVNKVTDIAAGTALGVATGGLGLVARNTVGRGMGILAESKLGAKIAAGSANNWGYRKLNNFINAGVKGSYNVGNASVKIGGKDYSVNDGVNKTLNRFGVRPSNLLAGNSLIGKDAGKGGFKAVDKKRAEAREKEYANRMNLDHLSDDQAKRAWELHIAKRTNNRARKKWRANENIDQEDGVKDTADKMKDLEKREKELAKEKEKLDKELAEAKKAGDATKISVAENNLRATERDINDNKTHKANLSDSLATLRKEKIAEIEKNGPESSAAYKKAQEKEKERLAKFGDVKNAKQFQAAMRSEYGTGLRENSFWLKDGKARYDGLATFLGPTVAAAFLPALGVSMGTALGAALGEGLTNNVFGDINNKAAEALEKSFKKTQGKGNKEARLAMEIEKIDEQLKQAAKDYHTAAGTTPPDKKVEDWEADEIDMVVEGKKALLDEEISKHEAALRGTLTDKERFAARMAMNLAKKQKDSLTKAMENRGKKQSELEKLKADAENKKSEEKK